MAKYFKASDYYPDDKDIYDFLDSQTRSIEPMVSFLRSRNIFPSKLSDKEQLQRYISLLYFDWQSASKLVNSVNIRETEQKVSHSKVDISADTQIVNSAVNTTKDDRHDVKREVYQIQQKGDEIEVNVIYIDIDTSKTRVLQKREKELQINATKTEEGWSFRYTSNERAKSIVEDILQKIKDDTSAEDVDERVVDISHIKDHENRVTFFKKMMMNMEGLRIVDVSNLKVDRLPPEEPIEEDTENQNHEDIEELERKLQRVIMYGADLFTVREFQDLVDDGFFISSAHWKSQKTDGDPEIVEYSAGFNDPSAGKNFDYKCLGVYRIDDAGNLKSTREKVYGSEKNKYLSALESSAYSALTLEEETGDEQDAQ